MSDRRRYRTRPVAVVAVFVVGSGLLSACSNSGGSHAKPATSGTGVERIVYRIEDRSRPPVRVTTQVVDVSAPYTARVLTLDGPPPGGTLLGGSAWDLGHQYVVDASGTSREVQQVPPELPGPDAHLDVALPSALRLGLVTRGGSRTIAGRSCTDWTSQQPLDSGPFTPPTRTDRTVSCVDAAGRLLAETWTLHGSVVRVRTAVEVGTAPSLAGLGLFAGRTPVPAPSGLSPESVKDVSAARLARALGIPVPASPVGLRLDRSTALIDVDRSSAVPRISAEGGAFAWTDGHRLVTLVVKRALGGAFHPPTDGVEVALGDNGSGRINPTYTGLQVELLTARGLQVTATGDVSEPDLLGWLRGLRLG